MVRLNFDFFLRKKKFANDESATQTNLSRVLGLLDVSAIGISSTLGSGIYILGNLFKKPKDRPNTTYALEDSI